MKTRGVGPATLSFQPNNRQAVRFLLEQQFNNVCAIFMLLGFPLNLTSAKANPNHFQEAINTTGKLIIIFQSEVSRSDQLCFAEIRNNDALAVQNPIIQNLLTILRTDPVKRGRLSMLFQEFRLNKFLLDFLTGTTSPPIFSSVFERIFCWLGRSPDCVRMMDIGAGFNGLFYLFNQTISSRHQIVLVDKDDFVVGLWRKGAEVKKSETGLTPNRNVSFKQCDFLALPPQADSSDLLLATMLFRYMGKDDQSRFFQQARTSLKPKTGTLIIVDSSYDLRNKDLASDVKQVSAQNGFSISEAGTFTEPLSRQKFFAYELLAA
jgi:hypothetical protein